MNRKAKIWSIVLGLIVVSGIALYSGSAELFQGQMSKSSNPLPAYDENKCYDSDGGKTHEEAGTVYGKISRSGFGNKTDVCTTRTKLKEYYCDGKFIQSEEYNCENGCSAGACNLPPCEGEICNDWKKLKTISTLDNVYKLLLVNGNIVSIVSVANNPDKSGVFVSFDQGQSWEKKVNGIINNIVYDDKGELLYAVGAVPDGDNFTGILYKSVNFGSDWNPLANFPNAARNILVEKNDSDKLYVFTQQKDFEFYVSEDGGQSWNNITFNYFPEEFIPWALAQNDEYIFVSGELEGADANNYHPPLLRSGDGGKNWENIFPENDWHIVDIEWLDNVTIFQQEGPEFFVGNKNGENIKLGGYLSNDNGNVIAVYDEQVFFGSVGGNVYKLSENSPSGVESALENLGSVVSDIDFDNGKMYITTFSDGILVFEKK